MNNQNFPFEQFFNKEAFFNNNNNNLDADNEKIKKPTNDDGLSTDELNLVKNEILNYLKCNISPQKYSAFFENTFAVSDIKSTKIVFHVTTSFIKQMIEKQYMQVIENSIINVFGKSRAIEIKSLGAPEVNEPTPIENKTKSVKDFKFSVSNINLNPEDKKSKVESKVLEHMGKSRMYNILIDPKKTFENFIVGASNRFAHATAASVASKPGKSYPSLYVHGDSGLGKTHLLHAIANEVLENDPTLKIHFTSANVFMSEMIECIRENKLADFRKRYSESIDVLIVDDIHELKNKDGTQNEFFHVFNELTNKKKQLIFTSDKHPKDITGLEDRVRTRLSGGMVVEINQPDFETRTAILKKKASDEDIYISDDVVDLIARSIKTNIRELEGSLINLGAYSSIYNIDIDVDIAREQLKLDQYDTKRSLKIDDITKTVSQFYDISISDLKSQARKKEITHARHVAMYLSHKLLNTTTTKVAEYFNRKDHTTVVHAIQKMKKLKNDQPTTLHEIFEIESKL